MKIPSVIPLTYFVLLLLVTTLTVSCRLVKSLGKYPDGDQLARIQQEPNYKNNEFQNLDAESDTTKVEGFSALKAMFNRPESVRPFYPVPSLKTDLKKLQAAAPTVIWFGHSSILIKTTTSTILIDPIFSSHAGPVPGMVKAFRGTKAYSAKDLPMIDVLVISHDHYDHLDYRTVKKIRGRVKKVVVPMGVGSHFLYWGYSPDQIVELNWNQSVALAAGIQITATPARHRSNRTLTENKTLWTSYVIHADGYKLFYSGDGGYGTHFKQIGKQYGPFDLALMECGQYSPNWPGHHMHPSQTAQAAADLQARMLQPVHWAKFAESTHPWNEPVNILLPAAKQLGVDVNIPRIGEPYTLGEPAKHSVWWAFD
jgi:L-ascorbate metabolism protein UlaG (beta-lactamase superfamily)